METVMTVFGGIGLFLLGMVIMTDGLKALAGNVLKQLLSKFTGGTFSAIISGTAITAIIQSSSAASLMTIGFVSAALVVTLTAIAADTLTFKQAALLVIGQNVGTTIKAYVASMGGTVPARRTAMTHIWFNLLTGLVAFILLPWLLSLVTYLGALMNMDDLAISLTMLNTLMYIVGMIVIVPLLKYFVAFITFLVPDRNSSLTEYLDKSAADVPAVAIEASRRTLIKVTKLIAAVGSQLFATKAYTAEMRSQLELASTALSETRQFVSLINNQSSSSSVAKDYAKQVALIHIIDHLERMLKALTDDGVVFYLNNGAIIYSD